MCVHAVAVWTYLHLARCLLLARSCGSIGNGTVWPSSGGREGRERMGWWAGPRPLIEGGCPLEGVRWFTEAHATGILHATRVVYLEQERDYFERDGVGVLE